uniref:Uncharacterized protein n=1 Tax=Anopheles quadriannulatus TaxID=34691 RepID=A0A182XSE1_ANOQN
MRCTGIQPVLSPAIGVKLVKLHPTIVSFNVSGNSISCRTVFILSLLISNRFCSHSVMHQARIIHIILSLTSKLSSSIRSTQFFDR